MVWLDNLGYEIDLGDEVFSLTGTTAYTVQKIKKLSSRKEVFSVATVVLESGITVYAHNVIGLRELGITSEQINVNMQGKMGFDTFGNPIKVCDKILYLHRMEMYTTVGIVRKLASKNCIMDIEKNRFGQITYKKPYMEIISLTALGLSEDIIKKENRY